MITIPIWLAIIVPLATATFGFLTCACLAAGSMGEGE